MLSEESIKDMQELEFAIFCIENIAEKLKKKADQVYVALTEKSSILNCRSGKDISDYEIVAGGVANDKVFNTIELYLDGLIDKAEAISRLRYEKPNMQICFRTEEVLKKYVHFKRSERV